MISYFPVFENRPNPGRKNSGLTKIILDISGRFVYDIQVGTSLQHLEKSRSWPSAHDWKSCIPQKGIEGSNPSFSAKKKSPFTTKSR